MSCVWKGDRATLHLGQLSFEIAQLYRQSLNTLDDLCCPSLVPVWSSLSAHILCTKAIDVAFVLTLDQIEKIFVIEALALAGLVAYDLVVVQVDVHILTICVTEDVEYFCFARFFCF